MKNLIFQYYIPYESFDKGIGGKELPQWAQAGSNSAENYAKQCGAEYELNYTRHFNHIDPRLDSLRLFYDESFDEYDNVLCLDLDMLIRTRKNVFDIIESNTDVAMVHELGIFTKRGSWLGRVMNPPLHERGIKAYGKHLFGSDWKFPRSSLYRDENYRYLNGGFQLWTKQGRLKARELFTSVDDYVLHTRYTEQMYINLQLSQPEFNVQELDTNWNRLSYQWSFNQPDGYINHYLGPQDKLRMVKK
jgi:hypothetical protein